MESRTYLLKIKHLPITRAWNIHCALQVEVSEEK